MPEWYLLHPAWVHFPIALLLLGFCAAVWRQAFGKPDWLAEAVTWLLWLGAASAWVAIALGQVAENTAPHVPSAWQVLNTHESLAYWSAGLFTALSIWRFLMRRGKTPIGRAWNWIFIAAWLGALAVLVSTAYEGGELVFTHGMGVNQSD